MLTSSAVVVIIKREKRTINAFRRRALEEKRVCSNGINVYGYKNEALHGFFISLFVRSGSMYEHEGEEGITHFLEHVLVRNVNKLMQMKLYGELDRYGMDFNASTYSEMVQFYVSGASHSFRRGVDIAEKLLMPIALSPAEIDAERKRIKAEIRESDEKTSLSAFTAETVFSGTSLACSILGTNTSVDRITLKRLEEYRKRVFTAQNVFFYVTGNYTDEDIDYLLKTVGDIQTGEGEIHDNIAPVPKDFCHRDPTIKLKNADYTVVRFTFDILMEKVSSPALDILYDQLFAGYASPFFLQMSEERGLFYDISGTTDRYRNIGTLHFTYELKEKNLYDAIDLSVKILSDFKTRLISEEECMKAGYVDNAYMLYDDSREFNFTFAYDNHIMKLGYPTVEARREAYRSVTPEQIRRTACEIFRPENLTLTLKGSRKKINIEKIREILKEL